MSRLNSYFHNISNRIRRRNHDSDSATSGINSKSDSQADENVSPDKVIKFNDAITQFASHNDPDLMPCEEESDDTQFFTTRSEGCEDKVLFSQEGAASLPAKVLPLNLKEAHEEEWNVKFSVSNLPELLPMLAQDGTYHAGIRGTLERLQGCETPNSTAISSTPVHILPPGGRDVNQVPERFSSFEPFRSTFDRPPRDELTAGASPRVARIAREFYDTIVDASPRRTDDSFGLSVLSGGGSPNRADAESEDWETAADLRDLGVRNNNTITTVPKISELLASSGECDSEGRRVLYDSRRYKHCDENVPKNTTVKLILRRLLFQLYCQTAECPICLCSLGSTLPTEDEEPNIEERRMVITCDESSHPSKEVQIKWVGPATGASCPVVACLPCGHFFCRGCLDYLVEAKATSAYGSLLSAPEKMRIKCPLCRKKVKCTNVCNISA